MRSISDLDHVFGGQNCFFINNELAERVSPRPSEGRPCYLWPLAASKEIRSKGAHLQTPANA